MVHLATLICCFGQRKPNFLDKPCTKIRFLLLKKYTFQQKLGKTSLQKSRFLSGIAQISQTPPPLNSDNLVIFIWMLKMTFCKYVGIKYEGLFQAGPMGRQLEVQARRAPGLLVSQNSKISMLRNRAGFWEIHWGAYPLPGVPISTRHFSQKNQPQLSYEFLKVKSKILQLHVLTMADCSSAEHGKWL